MNPLRLLAPCSLFLLAVPSLSCSTKAEPSTSGGAFFQLQGGDDPENPGKFLACPDGGKSVTIAVTGSDGNPKLVVDGADGASAVCSWTANTFSINVSTAAGTMIVSGTYTISGDVQKSTDARATVHFPGATYITRTTKCTVDFDMKQSGEGGKLFGKVTCPKLEHTEIAGSACAFNVLDPTRIPYFRFANCKY